MKVWGSSAGIARRGKLLPLVGRGGARKVGTTPSAIILAGLYNLCLAQSFATDPSPFPARGKGGAWAISLSLGNP